MSIATVRQTSGGGDATRRLVVVTHVAPDAALAATVDELAGWTSCDGVESVLRVEELGRGRRWHG